MTNSRNDKGQFVSKGNRWVVQKCNGKCIYYCHSDDELLFFTDDERVKEHTWGKMADGYSATRIDGIEVSAHRFISEPKDDELVDHIDRNKRNNLRSNLRNTDKSVNAFNAKQRSTNTSGRTGVWYRKDTRKWSAGIKKDYKRICLGCYETMEEAVAARKAAERILYGCELEK